MQVLLAPTLNLLFGLEKSEDDEVQVFTLNSRCLPPVVIRWQRVTVSSLNSVLLYKLQI